MLIKKIFLLILISPFLISSVNAGIEECEGAFDNQDYDLAFDECSQSYLYDNNRARFIIAVIFENGYGKIKQNQGLACRVFKEIDKHEHCDSFKKIDRLEFASILS